MTAYTETVGKRNMANQSTPAQTGILPAVGAAIPSLGGLGSTLAGIGSSLGIGAIGSKLGSLLTKVGSGASKAAGGLGGGTATGLAKLGLGTAAISELNKFMNSGPQIGGINILPTAVIGGGILLAANIFLK